MPIDLDMTWILCVFLLQDPVSQADQIRAAMAASLEKQAASVRVQAQSAAGSAIGRGAPSGTPCSPLSETEIDKMIDEVSQTEHVDAAVIREVARQESRLRPCAVSPKGAEGLMQLMPATQAQLQVRDPFDPRQSLQAGARLLKQLLDRYHGDLPLALSAYNAGAGKVDKSGGIPNITETKNYVAAILGHLINIWH
jgi:soluble lytic murein transglycosylase-like protein